jgi:adenylate cyclase
MPLLVLLVLVLLQWQVPAWVDRLELWTVDLRFWLRGEEEPQSSIIIVALDEDSVRMLGELQGENIRLWARARWAELIERIAEGEPRLIGVDSTLDTPGWDSGGDEVLAETVEAAGNVVLAAQLDWLGGESYRNTIFSRPIPVLEEAALGVGVANLPHDVDGAVRRTTLLYPGGDEVLPSFGLVIASVVSGERVQVAREDLDGAASIPIHFRGGEGTFQTLSMYRVLLEDIPEAIDPAVFRDAIVLVGFTTRLEQDLHPAPFVGKAEMPGVEIQANVVDTLLARDWLHRPLEGHLVLLVGAMGLVAIAVLNLRRPVVGVAIMFGIAVLYAALAVGLFIWADSLLPLVAPVLTTIIVGGAALTERMVFAEQDKRRLRQRFTGVMSAERLKVVMDNWEQLLETERPQKEAAVLFADIRGFTSTTETLMREGRSPEMVSFLSAYLDAMAEAVFVEGGAIYDVVGDGLMILFGLPETFPDYALRTVRGAFRMARATEALQAVWPLRDRHPMRMGIGLHCGLVVDAVVGRGRRVEYSVIGDPVNTAARIEAHSKVAMEIPRPPGGDVPETVTVLLSADLYEKVREHVVVDESVPPFEARGKAAPLQVVRLLGMREEVI